MEPGVGKLRVAVARYPVDGRVLTGMEVFCP